ncbi:hypothetical protein [Candidatus Thiosymbion oneisti]|uniref:hypothetical protein n=1 Tax=Candidatus Thiosymbion oneisti TaxID=589554 RepID=UPI00114CD252|nr:hypothetical protein [Candidatus Thiosymbion oneisti]
MNITQNWRFYRVIFVVGTLCIQGCATEPRYTVAVLHPQESEICVDQARNLKQACIEGRKETVDECKLRERTAYQQSLPNYNRALRVAQNDYNKCLNSCEKQRRKTDYYNMYGLNCYSRCYSLREYIDEIKSQKPSPREGECEIYYGICESKYNSIFKKCGGYKIEFCVDNCDEAPYLVRCQEGKCPPEQLKIYRFSIISSLKKAKKAK